MKRQFHCVQRIKNVFIQFFWFAAEHIFEYSRVLLTRSHSPDTSFIPEIKSDISDCILIFGFRSDRSTTDNLVRLETFIRDAFIKKEHVVAVFFDLEKAYDNTWRYGILKDIHKLGLRGRLPTFIENFLADRTMQVRVGSTLSDYYDQEQGVPQGGVLSTTLFSIKINDIVKCLGNLTDCSLYVDDFCICYRSKTWRRLNANCNKI